MVNPTLCRRCGTGCRDGGLCAQCDKTKRVDGASRARWVPLAACRTPYAAEVFGEAGEALTGISGHKAEVVQEAKSYCAECPVIQQCLAFAMHHEGIRATERWGVQGGLTPKERERRYYAGKKEA